MLWTNELMAGAERGTKKEKLRRYPRVARDASRLALAVEMLLDAAERDESMSVAEVCDAIDSVVSRDELRASVSHIRQVLPPVEVNPDGEWRATMIGRYASVRAFAPMLCQVIIFGATGEGQPVPAGRCAPCRNSSTRAHPSGRQPVGWTNAASMHAWSRPGGGIGSCTRRIAPTGRCTVPGTCSAYSGSRTACCCTGPTTPRIRASGPTRAPGC